MHMRCPSCRSTTFQLIEVFEEIEIREVRASVVAKAAIDHQPGRLLRTSCQCSCGK